MPDLYQTRAPRGSDIPFLAVIAEATLFPGEMMESMIAPSFAKDSEDLWRVVTQGDQVLGFAFAQPETMTDATWNVRAIAVTPEIHGAGAGTALLAAMEAALSDARLIVIDTTQTPDQARARQFYAARGYECVATILEFFGAGEDKVTFVKALK